MRDAFAKKVEKLQTCELQTVSFFELIETIWEGPNDQPFHRFCTLMRKMNSLSYVHEELILNQDSMNLHWVRMMDQNYLLMVSR